MDFYMTLSVLLCVLTGVLSDADQSVEVSTKYGGLRGLRSLINGQTLVDKFLNIPYAKPPVGQLRFRAPEPPVAWRGVRDATTLGPRCPQHAFPDMPPRLSFSDSEDCLVINVYRPARNNSTGPLPVMLWIHGGGYYIGTANLYDASQIATKGVVVVAVNYRLDAFGFLCTEDDAAMGNYGLLDVIRALQWVRDVISAFNGDPNNITIFGESAGSAMTSLLLMAKKARGLFHKAIMESGVSLTPWTVGLSRSKVQPGPLNLVKTLSEKLFCDVTDTSAMVGCLRTKDAMSIINITWEMASEFNQILFRPAITVGRHDSLLDVTPEHALTHDQFAHVPTLRGYSKNEWARAVNDTEDDGISFEEFRQSLSIFLDHWFIVQPAFHNDMTTVIDRFTRAYLPLGRQTNPKQLRQTMIQIATDVICIAPTLKEIELHAQNTPEPQYLYRFSYLPELAMRASWQGVVHGDEMPFVFGSPFTSDLLWPQAPRNWTRDDRQEADDVMTLWTNFAKYGNPTPTAVNGITWLPWTQATPSYLDIARPSQMRPVPNIPTVSFPASLEDPSVLVG
ncbi:neuroligin-4, X-linked-like [Littorina saxatilis]|uniref:Carboxylesterase type B domain-containing protein n=1 Tax=Littorina saxatilis TaxID=31220 RepID=A0AAN9B8B7_9CAEN